MMMTILMIMKKITAEGHRAAEGVEEVIAIKITCALNTKAGHIFFIHRV